MGCIIVGLTNGDRVVTDLTAQRTHIVSSLSTDMTPISSSLTARDSVVRLDFTPRPNTIQGVTFGMSCRIPIVEIETETYTPLTYIETTGEQYIDLGYVVKETDVIDMEYSIVSTASEDRFLFGTADGTIGLWISAYGNSGYIRFGYNSSYAWYPFSSSTILTLKKGSIKVGSTTKTLSYRAMPTTPLFLFSSRRNSTGMPYGFGYIRLKSFKITDENGIVMELLPHTRDSDGKVGLLDTVSGQFYVNSSNGDDFRYA